MKRRMGVGEILAPVLDAAIEDDRTLGQAVGSVSETLADLQISFVDSDGAPISGMTDEMAVLAVLDSYRQSLRDSGFDHAALAIGSLMARITSLSRTPPNHDL